MKKIKKIILPITSLLGVSGIVTTLATSCKETEFYSVLIDSDEGFSKATIRNKEVGKDLTINYILTSNNLEVDEEKTIIKVDGRQWYKEGIKYKDNQIIIKYDSDWSKETTFEIYLASKEQTYNVSLNPDDGFKSVSLQKITFGQDIFVYYELNDNYEFDMEQTKVTVDEVEYEEIEFVTNQLCIHTQPTWTSKTKIDVQFKSNNKKYNISLNPDDGFSSATITQNVCGSNIIINYEIADGYDMMSPEIYADGGFLPFVEGIDFTYDFNHLVIYAESMTWSYDPEEEILIYLHTNKQKYDIKIEDSRGFDNKPTIEQNELGKDIIVNYQLSSGYELDLSKTQVFAGEEQSLYESVEIDKEHSKIIIESSSQWTKTTPITLNISAKPHAYPITLDTANEGFTNVIISTTTDSEDIIVNYYFEDEGYKIDKTKSKVTIGAGSEEAYTKILYNDKDNQIIIQNDGELSSITDIYIVLFSEDTHYNATVITEEGDMGLGEINISNHVDQDIVISYEILSGYVIDKISTTVDVNGQMYNKITFDDSKKQIIVQKNKEWTIATPITIKVVSKKAYYNLEITQDGSFKSIIPQSIWMGNDVIVLDYEWADDASTSSIMVNVWANGYIYTRFDISYYDSNITIQSSDKWTDNTKIKVYVWSY